MGLMDLSKAGDAQKKRAYLQVLGRQTKKAEAQVLTVHDKAALRLGGRSGHLV